MRPNLAIVGATGAVGEIMRQVVAERKIPFTSIKFLASEKSAGKPISFLGKEYRVELIRPEAFIGVDIALSSTPASVSKEISPMAAAKGAIVIDNSSAWRMDPDVPLVVPEVNAHALRSIPKGIIANPNCSTIQMVVALQPLHAFAKIKRVVVSTYQASSGKGAKAVQELESQIKEYSRSGTIPQATVHADRLFGNVLPHDWKPGEDGYSEEEWKMILETRKIMGVPDLQICPTTVRVPVRVCHSESLVVEFYSPISPAQAKEILIKSPGIIVQDDPHGKNVPLALDCEGKDEVFVGRIRTDPTVQHGLALWVVADNLRKGAATNAVQIAQELLRMGIPKAK
ncbi:MAG: aspartate-semialdehyde dehydrogenase [Gemmataceae bacterium]|nr:aspartate-semialdehyde dehydrogenase [Gemmataceae bacterium]